MKMIMKTDSAADIRTSLTRVLNIFFFQAEDGIRDYKVTGVQTCALPICSFRCSETRLKRDNTDWRTECDGVKNRNRSLHFGSNRSVSDGSARASSRSSRSEERRVGEECRSRWSPDH